MNEPLKKPTQAQRILEVLTNANGQWVSGSYMLHTMLLSQYHARIWSLQKEGHKIEASDFTDKFGFKFYRIKQEGVQTSLFNKIITHEEGTKKLLGY
jgi:hypothetical protein